MKRYDITGLIDGIPQLSEDPKGDFCVANDVARPEYSVCNKHPMYTAISATAVALGCPVCRAEAAEKDVAFYRSCALSGEVPKAGSEPSVIGSKS